MIMLAPLKRFNSIFSRVVLLTESPFSLTETVSQRVLLMSNSWKLRQSKKPFGCMSLSFMVVQSRFVAAKRANVPGLKQFHPLRHNPYPMYSYSSLTCHPDVGFVDKEAVTVTSVSRKATFYNGPSSTDFINVHDIFLECDHDSVSFQKII
ncbi:hypothetical protein ZIOFF_037883 [Zingiber officinale]|uniref:Uncharacterized protein n=1 Tax=Zingiber officinale TaxID=94328 RepID=A0A8J5L4F9_ZINOF|nr:hypothetical protein ZIOFF_037883 [Zingiber officinale]